MGESGAGGGVGRRVVLKRLGLRALQLEVHTLRCLSARGILRGVTTITQAESIRTAPNWPACWPACWTAGGETLVGPVWRLSPAHRPGISGFRPRSEARPCGVRHNSPHSSSFGRPGCARHSELSERSFGSHNGWAAVVRRSRAEVRVTLDNTDRIRGFPRQSSLVTNY